MIDLFFSIVIIGVAICLLVNLLIYLINTFIYPLRLIFRLRYRDKSVENSFQERVSTLLNARRSYYKIKRQIKNLKRTPQDEILKRKLREQQNQFTWALNNNSLSDIFTSHDQMQITIDTRESERVRQENKVKDQEKAELALKDRAQNIMSNGHLWMIKLRRQASHTNQKENDTYPPLTRERRFYRYDNKNYLIVFESNGEIKHTADMIFYTEDELSTQYTNWGESDAQLTIHHLQYITDSYDQFSMEELQELVELEEASLEKHK